MSFRHPPRYAAWQHGGTRVGFEVTFLSPLDQGYRLEGDTAALEVGEAWAVRYAITVDSGWSTRSARVWGRSESGEREVLVKGDRAGAWRINGAEAPDLDGCLDVDLESSALTNALPVHRLGLDVGQEADAPAAYVRASDLSVERLEQRYVRLADDGNRARYHYEAPGFGFEAQLVYDEFGLVVDYPGIAVRAV